MVKKDLGQVLLQPRGAAGGADQARRSSRRRRRSTLTDDGARPQALELLEDPKLLDRILADFERCGVVGEETNKLVGYLAAVSRKLEEPLAVIIQSSSAAGKSSLMEAILALHARGGAGASTRR